LRVHSGLSKWGMCVTRVPLGTPDGVEVRTPAEAAEKVGTVKAAIKQAAATNGSRPRCAITRLGPMSQWRTWRKSMGQDYQNLTDSDALNT
jgi:gamma-glutamyl:cysteine ligase YbdK (ATP-grasp superfamily)